MEERDYMTLITPEKKYKWQRGKGEETRQIFCKTNNNFHFFDSPVAGRTGQMGSTFQPADQHRLCQSLHQLQQIHSAGLSRSWLCGLGLMLHEWHYNYTARDSVLLNVQSMFVLLQFAMSFSNKGTNIKWMKYMAKQSAHVYKPQSSWLLTFFA